MSVIAQKAAKVGRVPLRDETQRIFSQHVVQYQPSDPLYEETVDAKGKKKRVKVGSSGLPCTRLDASVVRYATPSARAAVVTRHACCVLCEMESITLCGSSHSQRAVPPGLSKRDQKALLKIRKRAHYLDKGMSLCGFRVGWTFFIGIIPGAGDIADATLNYCLVVRPAKKLDIPQALLTKMLFNNAVSAGVG
jgi:hypothetical protein